MYRHFNYLAAMALFHQARRPLSTKYQECLIRRNLTFGHWNPLGRIYPSGQFATGKPMVDIIDDEDNFDYAVANEMANFLDTLAMMCRSPR